MYNLTDRWRTFTTTPSVVREGGKIKISLSGGTCGRRSRTVGHRTKARFKMLKDKNCKRFDLESHQEDSRLLKFFHCNNDVTSIFAAKSGKTTEKPFSRNFVSRLRHYNTEILPTIKLSVSSQKVRKLLII